MTTRERRVRAGLAALLLPFVLCRADPVAAESCLDYDQHLRWTSSTYGFGDGLSDASGLMDIVMVGPYACVAVYGGTGVAVIDITDPASPRRRGTVALPSSDVTALAASGSHVFVADGVGGLAVVEVGDPDAPALKGSYPTSLPAVGVAVRDSLVAVVCGSYRGDGPGALQLFSLDAGGALRPRGSLAFASRACNVALAGRTAYVTCPDGDAAGLHVVDLTDPDAPRETGAEALSGELWGVEVVGDRAYVAIGAIGLGVIDIADPAHPQLIWSATLDAPRTVRAVAGGLLVASRDRWDLFSLADADRPAPTCGAPRPGRGQQVLTAAAASGDQVIASAFSYDWWESGGLHVFVTRGGNMATLRGVLSGSTFGTGDLLLYGSHAYRTAYEGLDVIDLATPEAPRLVSRIADDWRGPGSLAVTGGMLCRTWGTSADSLSVGLYDLADPAVPTRRGRVTVPLPGRYGLGVEITADNGLVCLARESSLAVVDVSDPNHPRQLGVATLPDWVYCVLLEQRALFVGTIGRGLLVYDLTDATAPAQIATIPYTAYELACRGTTLFGVNAGGLRTFDIASPGAPAPLGNVGAPGDLNNVALDGGFAYAISGAQMHVYDVRDPAAIRYLGAVETGGPVGVISTAVGLIGIAGDFVTNGTHGVFALAWPQCGALVPVSLAGFTAEPSTHAVDLRWGVRTDCALAEFRLTARAGGLSWEVPFAADPGCAYRAHDASPGVRPGVTITYALDLREDAGDWTNLAMRQVRVGSGVPSELHLAGASPNPFNPGTTIRFNLPMAGQARLAVYDVAGRLVRVLVDGELPAGGHETAWDGRDSAGRALASGSYLARLEAGGKVEVARMGLVR
ncbi:MAG: FlgD immunoglobulin-like domain containing protein [Candidatus Krumholzibacteriia bacterium]